MCLLEDSELNIEVSYTTMAMTVHMPHLQSPALKILFLIKHIMQSILDGRMEMADGTLVHEDIRRRPLQSAVLQG